jgi:hypothetical protein
VSIGHVCFLLAQQTKRSVFGEGEEMERIVSGCCTAKCKSELTGLPHRLCKAWLLGPLDPAGLASSRGSHQLLPSGNNTVSDLSLLSHLLTLASPPLLAWHGMAICPTFIHVVLVYVAHIRRAIPALPSSQLTNPTAAPRFFLPRAQCSHQSPRRTIWNPLHLPSNPSPVQVQAP